MTPTVLGLCVPTFGALSFLVGNKFSGHGPALAALFRDRRTSWGMDSFGREAGRGLFPFTSGSTKKVTGKKSSMECLGS